MRMMNEPSIRDRKSTVEDDNLFEEQQGRTFLWKNVNLTLKTKSETKTILDNVYGTVPRQQTTSILGASGSGKTSLLEILAGRLGPHSSRKSNLHTRAEIYSDDTLINPQNMHTRQAIAFVAQDDALSDTSTPRESLYFSARLRRPRSDSEAKITQVVNNLLAHLGLEDCADTVIGEELSKGISGGERIRTQIGIELGRYSSRFVFMLCDFNLS
jgi:ABC-type multidrug transport system ATPase subunit